MRIDRPYSEILSCQTRVRREMQNARPQRHTTTINSIKNTGHKSNREPSMKNAQRNTHTRTRTREVEDESKTGKFEFGKKKINFFLFSITESTGSMVDCHSATRQREN